jgi:hypothetical protein
MLRCLLYGRRMPQTMLSGLTLLFAAGLATHDPAWAAAGLACALWSGLRWRHATGLPLVVYWLFVSLANTLDMPTTVLPMYWGMAACAGWLYLNRDCQ